MQNHHSISQPLLPKSLCKVENAGGDIHSCLDATDILRSLNTLPPQTNIVMVDPHLFFNYRTGACTEDDFFSLIKDERRIYLIPVHLRHHWCLVVQHQTNLHVYDSCASEQIRRDIQRWFHRTADTVVRHTAPRQHRNSNECGLFVLLFICAIRRFYEHNSHAVPPPDLSDRYLCLDAWRRRLPGTGFLTNELLDLCSSGGALTDTSAARVASAQQAHARLEKQCASLLLCYALVGVLLGALVTDDTDFTTLSVEDVVAEVDRFIGTPNEFPRHTEHDVRDLLLVQGVTVYTFVPPVIPGNSECPLPSDSLFLAAYDFASPHKAPPSVDFIVGAAFHGTITAHGAYHGHWVLSTTESKCSVGLFRPVALPPPHAGVDSNLSEPLPLAAVRSFARSLVVGQRIAVRFVFDGEMESWFGTVDRKYHTALWPVIRYDAKLCDECGETACMDTIKVLLPSSGVTYLALKLVDASNPTCACSHETQSDDDEFDLAERVHAHHDVETGALMAPEPVPLRRNNPYDTGSAPVAAPSPTDLGHTDTGPDPDDLALLYSTIPVVPLTSTSLRGEFFRNVFIYAGCPPHVSKLSWSQMSEATRASHRRWLVILRNMPADLATMPLGPAIVETIGRLAAARRWAPATVSRAYSDCTTACRLLPLYTNRPTGLSLRVDPVYDSAMRAVQKIVTRVPQRAIARMSASSFQTVLNSVQCPSARTLLTLAWYGAMRLGDARQLDPSQVWFEEDQLVVRFTRGKGPAFRGAYNIRVQVTAALQKAIRTYVAAFSRELRLFSVADQAAVARALHKHALEARSIRKGRLCELADAGCSTEQLMQLSGHLRVETLHKYIGRSTVTATKLASATAEHDPVSRGGALNVSEPAVVLPQLTLGPEVAPYVHPGVNVMGTHSGHKIQQGQRFARDPPFFPRAMPSSHDLGIVSEEDMTSWPLHVKPLPGSIRTKEVLRLCPTDFKTELEAALSFLEVRNNFFIPTAPYDFTDVPLARCFTDTDLELLLANEKIELHEGPVWGAVNSFVVPSKGRRRAIFEPLHNVSRLHSAVCAHLPPVPLCRYESRLEKRHPHAFVKTLDCSVFFDQFALSNPIRDLYCFRATHQGIQKVFRLCRLPMGGCPSPSIAQYTLWAVLPWETAHRVEVYITTCIDNVRFCGMNEVSVALVHTEFLRNCATVGITLNEEEFTGYAPADYVFLGEKYLRRETMSSPRIFTYVVQNTDAFVAKLDKAFELYKTAIKVPQSPSYSNRLFAALMGLVFWGTHTLGIRLSSVFVLMRAVRALHRSATTFGWDCAFRGIGYADKCLTDLVLQLRHNVPVELTEVASRFPVVCPTFAFVDACADGWGAIVVSQGKAETIQQRFRFPIAFSAEAEPFAATQLVKYLKARDPPFPGPFHIVSDHAAITTGQYDARTGLKGFSPSPFLNRLYCEAANDFFFSYVKGEENPADTLSRTTCTHARAVTPTTCTFVQPPLAEAGSEAQSRPYYMR